MKKPALVFVYNADSGFVSTLLDIGHKIVSPQTYACNLCAITHSTFSMRDEWKNFVAGLGVPVEFLHRDELVERHGLRDVKLPAIFLKMEDGLKPWISREEIDRCRSLGELKRLVEQKLKA
ncbi:hypothetical protein SCL_0574 [Sulfuricaulis limicola]|uniref:GTPase n=1 Tax=Sulfuricaulis limicola TaxID=1620215 RepID=A0A1B4XDL5_9GAMM|nr:hypothetical protein [Sulfuricaulis limicola]BAV32896.1 hypothetical protein SCL_0574 [Sulfuricaulis limicola]